VARTGLYQSEVRKARDALVAQGTYPSVDAVRIALGNTGSKTTIHKYLKELDEQVDTGKSVSISDTLLDIVERLAARLHEEADARVATAHEQFIQVNQAHKLALQTADERQGRLEEQLAQAASLLAEERSAHEVTREVLRSEHDSRLQIQEQVNGLTSRLNDNLAYGVSLEAKHRQAREALEHFRQLSKEQRDHEHRQHEQQIQQLHSDMRNLQQTLTAKQSDIAQLNHEGSRLISDLANANKNLFDIRAAQRDQARLLSAAQEDAKRVAILAAQLADRDALISSMERSVAKWYDSNEALSNRVHQLEADLASSEATLMSRQEVIEGLRAHLASLKSGHRASDTKNI
jgi:DNA repair exonuclease SbcCD ATPase subunit